MKTYQLVLIASFIAGLAGAKQDGRRPNRVDVSAVESISRDDWQKPTQVVEALGIQPGMVIADIGTGAGYFVPYLARATGGSGTVYAVDIQPEMLVLVKRKIDQHHLSNVTTVLSQEDDTRLETASVDLALLVDVYHELGAARALLTNIASILKPGGRLAIIDFYADKQVPGIGPPLHHRVPPERLLAEVQATGSFTLLERHGFLPHQYFLVFAAEDEREEEPLS